MKNKIDLTNGNINKALFAFALPMILGNLLQQFYNIADTWVVGKFVGADALASVGSAYTLMTFLTSILIGMCMGSGALFSYYFGGGDKEKLKSCMHTAFVMIGVISLILTLLVRIFTDAILWFLQIPDELYELMRQYVDIVFLGIVFVFLYNYFAFLLRALGNSVAPLFFLGSAAILNVFLDLVFVLQFHLGIQGAAVATLISQAVSGIGLGIYTWIKEPQFRFSLREFRQGRKPFREIVKFSMTASAQQSVMNFGILLVQGLVNSFGANIMAAFAAAVKIDTFAYMPAQEFGNAYSIYISQNYGAGKNDRIRQGSKSAFQASILFCAVISLFIFLFPRYLMMIFVDPQETEILKAGMQYLRIEGAFYALIGILFLLYGYFRGINRPEISFILTILSLGIRVVLAYVLSAIPSIGVLGIWWAIPIGWLIADAVGIWIMKKRA